MAVLKAPLDPSTVVVAVDPGKGALSSTPSRAPASNPRDKAHTACGLASLPTRTYAAPSTRHCSPDPALLLSHAGRLRPSPASMDRQRRHHLGRVIRWHFLTMTS